MKPVNVLTHALGFRKRQFSWRGFRKTSAKLPILHALRLLCRIGGPKGTEMCL